MRAIIVDPFTRHVFEQNIKGDLDSLQEIVGGSIEYLPLDIKGHHMYVNANGRLMPVLQSSSWFLRVGKVDPIFGHAIILRSTIDGGEAPAKVSVTKVKKLIRW